MAFFKFELLTTRKRGAIICKFALMRFATLIITTLFMHGAIAQDAVTLSKLNCDCSGAIEIEDTIIGPVISPAGFGQSLEIDGNDISDPMWIEREHNSVWYKFEATHTSEIAIDIIPVRDEDDFDFLLFHSNAPNFCYEVPDGLHQPVRTNISRVNTENNGQTGLTWDATESFVAAGPGSPYSKSIEVVGGDMYYLLVDNPHRANEGHTIVIHYKDKPSDNRRRRTDDTTATADIEPKAVMLYIVDENGEPTTADIVVEGVYATSDLTALGVSELEFESNKLYKTFTVKTTKAGYMLSVTKVTAGSDTTIAEIVLKPIEVGNTMAIHDIKFVGDEATILKTSEDALQQLVDFMLANPDVEIEIGGHVNAPDQKNKKVHKVLSKDRAEAVYNHLVLAGIDKKRMKYKGYGNTQMIYTNPVTDQQQEANRRVEITILDH